VSGSVDDGGGGGAGGAMAEVASSGASGSYFYFTPCRRYIVKTISIKEKVPSRPSRV